MKDLIQQNRHNPKKLEEFYRQNKTEFKKILMQKVVCIDL